MAKTFLDLILGRNPKPSPLSDNRPALRMDEQVVWYADSGQTHVEKGYNGNADVYSIVSRSAQKAAQVPWYVYRVKKNAQKDLQLYKALTKENSNPASYREVVKMRTKALDEQVVNNPLAKLLARPNRHQGQDSFFENVFGFKLLTGEGNIWLNAEDENSAPDELFVIPKQHLLLVAEKGDPWGVKGYVLVIAGKQNRVDQGNIIMWKSQSYDFDPVTLSHLRGRAPLAAMLLPLQASNAAAMREVRLYENAGVNGILFDESQRPTPLTMEQVSQVRDMVGNRVAGIDKIGTVTTLQGKWGYLQMGMDAQQLRLMEQKKLTTQTLCNGFGFPYELMNPETTFANKLEAKRGWVYDMIAPMCYSLRDELNRVLLPRFGLKREEYFIDCDVMALPDVAEDLQKQVNAVRDAWWLTPNQRLAYMGYDESADPLMNKVYAPAGLKPLDQLAAGEGLDDEEETLRNSNLI